MKLIDRRLARLEQLYRPVDPFDSIQRLWLGTLSEAELEDLSVALEHTEAGGDVNALPLEIRDHYHELLESFAAFQQEHAQ